MLSIFSVINIRRPISNHVWRIRLEARQPKTGLTINLKIGPARETGLTLPSYLGSSHKKSNWIVCNGGKGRRRCLHSLQASPWIIRCSFGAIPNSRTTPHQGKTSQVRTPQQDYQQVWNCKLSPNQHKTSQDRTSFKHLVSRFLVRQLRRVHICHLPSTDPIPIVCIP